MSHFNNNHEDRIIKKRYSVVSDIKKYDKKKVEDYNAKILRISFLKITLLIYAIIATSNIIFCVGTINRKKIILCFLCANLHSFTSSVSNTAFFNSII